MQLHSNNLIQMNSNGHNLIHRNWMNFSVADHYDNKSVTIISYAYGPGYFYNHDDNGKRIDLDSVTIGKEIYVF